MHTFCAHIFWIELESARPRKTIFMLRKLSIYMLGLPHNRTIDMMRENDCVLPKRSVNWIEKLIKIMFNRIFFREYNALPREYLQILLFVHKRWSAQFFFFFNNVNRRRIRQEEKNKNTHTHWEWNSSLGNIKMWQWDQYATTTTTNQRHRQ